MSNPNYAAMTDAQLNEAAARAMGWDYYINGDGEDGERVVLCVIVKIGEDRNGSPEIEKRPLYTFDPANDLNHAAEFSAWFRERERKEGRWYNLTIKSVIQQNAAGVQVERFRCKLWRGQAVDRDNGMFYALCDSRARAETEATLAAVHGTG